MDWFHFETAIRKEVHNLLIPFKDELRVSKDLAFKKYNYVDKLVERIHQLEVYAMIEPSGEKDENEPERKKNKFDYLED